MVIHLKTVNKQCRCAVTRACSLTRNGRRHDGRRSLIITHQLVSQPARGTSVEILEVACFRSEIGAISLRRGEH